VTRALEAELLKLRTTRTFLAFVASAVGLSLLVVILFTALADFDQEDVRSAFTADFTSLFIALLGAIGMAGEWRHRTIANTVLSIPQRARLLGAKLIAYAVGGALLSLFVSVAIMIAGTLILSSRGIDTLSFGDLLDLLWRNLAIAALLGPIGVCVGTLIRNPAVAIVVILAWGFVLENVLAGVAPEVEKFMPLQGASSGVQQVDNGFETLPAGVALLVMAGWVVLLAVPALVTFSKRDLV
jgi:ABC-2 type transport system permease protein